LHQVACESDSNDPGAAARSKYIFLARGGDHENARGLAGTAAIRRLRKGEPDRSRLQVLSATKDQMMEQRTHELMTRLDALMPLIVSHALSAVGAVVILLIGLWLSSRADAFAVRMLGRTPHVDPMLRDFFGDLIRYLILIVTVLAVLSRFGIQTTSLVAVLGA